MSAALGLLDATSSCSLVDCSVEVRVSGLVSVVSQRMFFRNVGRDLADATFRTKVAEGATIMSFDSFVEADGNLEPRTLRNPSLDGSIFGCNVGKIRAGRDAVVFLSYSHKASSDTSINAIFRFPLPGNGENMIVRARHEDSTWNASHSFSFVSVDIEASMPGNITHAGSTTHIVDTTLDRNKAQMTIEDHVLRGADDLEFSITADDYEGATLTTQGTWGFEEFDSDRLLSLIPRDENKFNVFQEPKSLVSKVVTVKVLEMSESFLDFGDDDTRTIGRRSVITVQQDKPEEPELRSWYIEDSSDDESEGEIESEDESEDEIDIDEMDMDLRRQTQIFLGTAFAVNHRRPSKVKVVELNNNRRNSNSSDGSDDSNSSTNSGNTLRKRYAQAESSPALVYLCSALESSETGFLALDEDLARIVGIRLQKIIDFLKYAQPAEDIDPAVPLVGAWANMVALAYLRSLNIDSGCERETLDRLYYLLHSPLLQTNSLPLPLMSEMATNLFRKGVSRRKLREVAVFGFGVFTPPASPLNGKERRHGWV